MYPIDLICIKTITSPSVPRNGSGLIVLNEIYWWCDHFSNISSIDCIEHKLQFGLVNGDIQLNNDCISFGI